ncbi:uncharacterized protein LOC126738958 [Anthonomus grandis grandis]|uniref:uncharacterized protein LOC126738958 n=1 Tax=Anthonomus grandis grandis TaxID=2921223 RepID=UPI0021654521|nr:uncharacterized protein LOC126738958 [Anthonomus grandis grandis]
MGTQNHLFLVLICFQPASWILILEFMLIPSEAAVACYFCKRDCQIAMRRINCSKISKIVLSSVTNHRSLEGQLTETTKPFLEINDTHAGFKENYNKLSTKTDASKGATNVTFNAENTGDRHVTSDADTNNNTSNINSVFNVLTVDGINSTSTTKTIGKKISSFSFETSKDISVRPTANRLKEERDHSKGSFSKTSMSDSESSSSDTISKEHKRYKETSSIANMLDSENRLAKNRKQTEKVAVTASSSHGQTPWITHNGSHKICTCISHKRKHIVYHDRYEEGLDGYLGRKSRLENMEYYCFTLKEKTSSGKEEEFRGCTVYRTCDLLKSKIRSISCSICERDNCNSSQNIKPFSIFFIVALNKMLFW